MGMRSAFRVAAYVRMSLRRGATLGDIGTLTSSHRVALQNSKAMSSRTLQTTDEVCSRKLIYLSSFLLCLVMFQNERHTEITKTYLFLGKYLYTCIVHKVSIL